MMVRKNYIGMGYQFHQLVSESISEMIKEGNRTVIFSDYDKNQSDEDSWKEYESKTRWNDYVFFYLTRQTKMFGVGFRE